MVRNVPLKARFEALPKSKARQSMDLNLGIVPMGPRSRRKTQQSPKWLRARLNVSRQKPIAALIRIVKRLAMLVLRKAKWSVLQFTARKIAKTLISQRGTSLYLRRIVDYSLPNEPISAKGVLPSIELLIVAGPKDFPLLPLVIESASQNCKNPLSRVFAVVPDKNIENLPRLPNMVQVVGEGKVLPAEVRSAIGNHHPEGRKAWVLQQALKLWFARESDAPGVLILDADTVLAKPRTFLNSDGKQLLSYSHEYEQAYETHAAEVWGRRITDFGMSYVCHHQMMQPNVLRHMFPSARHLKRWVLAADLTHHSPISEYHSYGRFLADNYPSRISYGSWGNKAAGIVRGKADENRQMLEHLENVTKETFSISFHHYLA